MNISTQLEYLNQEFWLELSLDESSTWLELKYSTWRDQSNWKTTVSLNQQLTQWSHQYAEWALKLKRLDFTTQWTLTSCTRQSQKESETTRSCFW